MMYKLDFETGEVSPLGSCIPADGLYEMPAKDGCWLIHGFDIDKEGVLWLTVSHWSLHNDTPYDFPCVSYLIRWDADRGEEPFCCGVIGTTERVQEYVSEMEYDHVNDILYWVNTATERPFVQDRSTVGGIDLSVFRKHYTERGPVSDDEFMTVRALTPEEIEARKRKVESRATEENSPQNPFAAFDPLKLTPVRIWRSFPRLEVEQSKVICMAFQPDRCGEDYLLHVVCRDGGCFEKASYVLQIVGNRVNKIEKMEAVSDDYRRWLRANILPQPLQFDASVKLPEATGRRFRAVASCAVEWKDGKQFVGTTDALAAIVSKDGSVYSLGNAAAYGPIRSMITKRAKDQLWGVAGDDEDMGYIFTYNDVNGLRQLGIINYNTHGYYDGPIAANLLSAITLSPDEKYLAIGSADRIAMVCIVEL